MASGQTTEPTAVETALAVAALMSEVALAVGAAVGAYLAASGAWRGVAAAVAIIVVLGVWAVFMAPRSERRLPLPGRIVVGCGLFVAAGGLLATSHLVTGLALLVLGCGITVLSQPALARHQPTPAGQRVR